MSEPSSKRRRKKKKRTASTTFPASPSSASPRLSSSVRSTLSTLGPGCTSPAAFGGRSSLPRLPPLAVLPGRITLPRLARSSSLPRASTTPVSSTSTTLSSTVSSASATLTTDRRRASSPRVAGSGEAIRLDGGRSLGHDGSSGMGGEALERRKSRVVVGPVEGLLSLGRNGGERRGAVRVRSGGYSPTESGGSGSRSRLYDGCRGGRLLSLGDLVGPGRDLVVSGNGDVFGQLGRLEERRRGLGGGTVEEGNGRVGGVEGCRFGSRVNGGGRKRELLGKRGEAGDELLDATDWVGREAQRQSREWKEGGDKQVTLGRTVSSEPAASLESFSIASLWPPRRGPLAKW